MKNSAICSRWFDVSSACTFRWLIWYFYFSENFLFILTICLIFFFFSCYEEVENATRCRKFRSHSNLKIMSFFFFIHFISCEFFSWWIVRSCLSIVVCVHSFKCSKMCSALRRRIENILIQSISAFCLTCLTMRLICTMMISCNSFCLTFATLWWKFF